MSRAAEKREQARDRERDYLAKFLNRLDAAGDLHAAANVAYEAMPGSGDVGRLRHTSLIHFLNAIEKTGGTPPFRVNPSYPVVPHAATRGEREAYASLAGRLAAAGEISAADAEHVQRAVAAFPPGGLDFI